MFGTASRSARRWEPWAVVLVALALRLVLLTSVGEQFFAEWVVQEEQHRGNIAHEVLSGPLLDLQDYHHAPNVGGSLVIGLLAVPCMWLLGPSLGAVRLPTVLLHCAAVYLLFRLLERYASRRAAWIGALLLALAPPGYALISITAWGTHLETNTLVLLAAWILLGLQDELERGAPVPRVTWRALALGLVSGFACYFGYSFVIGLASLLALAALRDRLFFTRRWFALALLGFALGILPWLRYNLQHDFAGLEIYHRTPGADAAASWLEPARRLAWFFTDYFPGALFLRRFEPVDLGWAAQPVAWTLSLLAVACAWSARRSRLALWSTLYVPLFLASFALASMVQVGLEPSLAHDGRYLCPLVPFLCLSAGIALDRLWQRMRMLAAGVAVLLIGLFALADAELVDARDWGRGWRMPGASDEAFATWFTWTYKTDLARLDRLVDGLEARRSEEVRDGTLFIVGQALRSRWSAPTPSDPERARAQRDCGRALAHLGARVAPEYRDYFDLSRPADPLYPWSQRARYRAEQR